MSKFEVTRKGTWPILKYTVRGEHGHYAVVMIDDEHGSLFINPGNQIALQHFWGKDGRGTNTLREFFIRDSRGYMGDKLSYGLTRWTYHEAMKDLRAKCEEQFGHPDSWPDEVQEIVEQLDGIGNCSSDLFYYVLQTCDVVMEAFGYDGGFGELQENPEVKHFLETKWPHLIEFWKKELVEEGRVNVTSAV